MAAQTAFLVLVALALFYFLASKHVENERCPYCGSISSRTPECPYNLERLT